MCARHARLSDGLNVCKAYGKVGKQFFCSIFDFLGVTFVWDYLNESGNIFCWIKYLIEIVAIFIAFIKYTNQMI